MAEEGESVQLVIVREPEEERVMMEAVCPEGGSSLRFSKERYPDPTGKKMVEAEEERLIMVLALPPPVYLNL
jgi:hypothetical protein